MNQSQVENFLACLSQIENNNFLSQRAQQNQHAHSQNNHDHNQVHEHEHQQESEDAALDAKILIAKATAMAVLFGASSLCGSIPFLLNRCFKWTERQDSARSAWIVQCLLYFGGGVLLATTFLHLLPEVQETVERMKECQVLPVLSFPLAELLMCTGFFMMYLIEEALHLYIRKHRKNLGLNKGAGAAFERGHSVRNSFLIRGKQPKNAPNISMQNVLETETSKKSETITVNHVEQQDIEIASKLENHHAGHGHSHSHFPIDEADGMLTSSLRGLFVVLALSLHELFEGMAIGLETSSAKAVWFMFGAVSAHKLVLSFCVGVELIVARTRFYLAIIYVLTFAIVSPIGIGIGILLSSGTSGNAAPSIPSAILQGLACGTLLYVVFFEILSKENSGLKTYIALVFGFVIMFALQQIGTEGSHGHSHGGCDGHSHEDRADNTHSKTNLPAQNEPNLEQQIQILRLASKTIYDKMKHK